MQDRFKAQRLLADVKDLLCNFIHLVHIVLCEACYFFGSSSMSRNKQTSLHGFHCFQRLQIRGNIVDKSDLVFIQRFPTGQTIRQIDHIV